MPNDAIVRQAVFVDASIASSLEHKTVHVTVRLVFREETVGTLAEQFAQSSRHLLRSLPRLPVDLPSAPASCLQRVCEAKGD